MTSFLNLIFTLTALFVSLICFAQEITIQRVYSEDYVIGGCILGYLSIDGEILCHTLELPYRNNQSDISSIPAGQYDAFIRTDGRRGWRLELYHVPSRSHIQVHVGNFTNDITGCTLVGMEASVDYCEVYQSRVALNIIRQKIEPYIGQPITVRYTGY